MTNEVKKPSSYKKFIQNMERKMPVSHLALKTLPWIGGGLLALGAVFKAPVLIGISILARLAIPMAVLIVAADKLNSFVGRITKTRNNEANQTIKAPANILNQLEIAQSQINKASIKKKFNKRSEITQEEKKPIAEIVRDVMPLIEKVTVLENRDKEFSKSAYEFTIPVNGKKIPLQKFLTENKF